MILSHGETKKNLSDFYIFCFVVPLKLNRTVKWTILVKTQGGASIFTFKSVPIVPKYYGTGSFLSPSLSILSS